MGLKEMLMAAAEAQADKVRDEMVGQLQSDDMAKKIATKINEKIDILTKGISIFSLIFVAIFLAMSSD